MTDRRSIADFLALRRNTVLLLEALVLAGTGERLWLGCAPKSLETLGAGVLIIGLFDALQTFLGAVYAYPGGWLTDQWGQHQPASELHRRGSLRRTGYGLVLVVCVSFQTRHVWNNRTSINRQGGRLIFARAGHETTDGPRGVESDHVPKVLRVNGCR